MEVALHYTPGSRIAGFNLVGNPFPVKAYPNRSYYMMSEEGDAILATPHSASEFNLTGNDVNLLQTPTYTFQARTDDYASRFRLVFSFTGIDENNAEPDNDFAFISNGELIINGEGTLQVFDILGHELFRKELSTFHSPLSTFRSPGVYVLRLVDGDNVKTQKIVVK